MSAGANHYIPRYLRRAAIHSQPIMSARHQHRKLIVVQLSGGNDGLNTIVPYRDDNYYNLRPQIGISKDKVRDIDGNHGFNLGLSGLGQLYDQGLVSIINSVGYPNPNRSHFVSMDIWHTGSLQLTKEMTGWLGRYLDHYGPDHNSLGAIETSDLLSLALRGEHNNGIAVNDIMSYFQEMKSREIQQSITQPIPKITDNPNLELIYRKLQQGYYSIEPIVEKFKQTSIAANYSNDEFGKDCKAVSDLILTGSSTQIYYIPHGGFDTHVSQVGKHQRLLTSLGDNLLELVNTLKVNGMWNDVSILVFSEFGRRVKENGSKGTDHGAANNLFVLSPLLAQPGFFNSAPDLSDLEDGDIKYQIDFRSVYTDLLADWLGVDAELILRDQFPRLGLFKSDLA